MQLALVEKVVQPTRKLAAILSSDVFGYSRLMGDDEQATFEAVVGVRALMKRHVQAHAGRVVDATGDALLAEFASAVEAVLCACEIQRELARVNADRPEHRRMLIRIGINLGDVLESDGAIYGDGVNIAARVQTAGEPGGVCVSGSVHEQVADRLPLRFDAVGERSFKNIARPVQAFHVREAGSGHRPQPAHPGPSIPAANNLPRQLSSFVGRGADIAAVHALLAAGRLVSLVGPGGIGKTRLALQVAAQVASTVADEVWLVELEALADPRLVPQAVASALGIKAEPGSPVVQALLAALRDRRMLIVLDNCEHLPQACADLARQLLQAGPGLRVLATSREPLRVSGEASHPLAVLALPGPQASAAREVADESEAVQLFVARARAVQPGFVLTAQNWASVAAICRRLDGIALAIELAAARVRSMSVDSIAERLGDRFHLLSQGDRTALPRQQTLRALIDWSYDLLAEPERALLRRLAVFAGGWTLEAAEAVGSVDAGHTHEVADLLGRLVEKSMVESEVGAQRYRLLQTVRQYAQDRLDETGKADAVRDRHLACMLDFAEAARVRLSGPDQAEWLALLDAETDNILCAHAWCDRAPDGAEAGLRLMFSLKLYLFNRGLLAPLRRGVLDALARPGAQARSIHRCRALQTAGQAGFMTGRFAEAQAHLEEALAIAQELGDAGRAASVLQTLGMTCVAQGDRAAAHRFLQQALALAQERGDQREHAAALNALAQLHRIEGTLDTAQPLYEQALALTRDLGDHENTAVALLNLALVSIGRGAPAPAAGLLLQALDIAEAIGSQLTGANVLAISAGVAALRADAARAAGFHGAAQAQLKRTGLHLDPVDEAVLLPLAAQAREALAPQDASAEEAAGRAASYLEAMAAARAWLLSR